MSTRSRPQARATARQQPEPTIPEEPNRATGKAAPPTEVEEPESDGHNFRSRRGPGQYQIINGPDESAVRKQNIKIYEKRLKTLEENGYEFMGGETGKLKRIENARRNHLARKAAEEERQKKIKNEEEALRKVALREMREDMESRVEYRKRETRAATREATEARRVEDATNGGKSVPVQKDTAPVGKKSATQTGKGKSAQKQTAYKKPEEVFEEENEVQSVPAPKSKSKSKAASAKQQLKSVQKSKRSASVARSLGQQTPSDNEASGSENEADELQAAPVTIKSRFKSAAQSAKNSVNGGKGSRSSVAVKSEKHSFSARAPYAPQPEEFSEDEEEDDSEEQDIKSEKKHSFSMRGPYTPNPEAFSEDEEEDEDADESDGEGNNGDDTVESLESPVPTQTPSRKSSRATKNSRAASQAPASSRKVGSRTPVRSTKQSIVYESEDEALERAPAPHASKTKSTTRKPVSQAQASSKKSQATDMTEESKSVLEKKKRSKVIPWGWRID